MILSIETSTTVCSAAIIENGKVINSKSVNEKNIHSEKLLSFIDEILNEKNIKLSDLKKISVSAGPGSFTGLRIGLSIAKGICFAKNLKLDLVPTLESFAFEFSRNKKIKLGEKIAVLINSKNNEAYFSFYEFDGRIFKNILKYDIKNRVSIFELIENEKIETLVTDEPEKIIENISQNIKIEKIICTAESVGLLSEIENFSVDVFDAEPIYVRSFIK